MRTGDYVYGIESLTHEAHHNVRGKMERRKDEPTNESALRPTTGS